MGKINMTRALLGGLLAGLVLNIGEYVLNEPILGEQWKVAMESLSKPPMGSGAMVWFVIMSFLGGIAMIWVYAAIRPRFGAGPKTAIFAGLTVWFFAWFWGFGSMVTMGLFPFNLLLTSLIWGLFEVPIAALAGAWLYKEE